MIARLQPQQIRRIYLREWREHLGLTQEAIAAELGTDKGTVSKWENQKRTINLNMLMELSRVMGIQPGAIFYPPTRPSLDAMVSGLPDEAFDQARKIVETFIKPSH